MALGRKTDPWHRVSSLTGALVKTVQPANGRFLTLEDIEPRVDLSGDVHSCPVRVISLENTLNGVVMPLDEVKRISDWARSHGIKLHCDGARLWEAVAADAGTLSQFAACFDSVTLCFSKGLGAPIGSILVGDRSFIDHARWIRKSIGGGLRQAGVVSAPALVAVRETFEAGRLAASHVVARRVEKMWRDKGGQVKLPVDTNMVWLDLDSALTTESRLQQLGEEAGLRLMGNRLVCHYQIGDEALERLENVFNRVFQEKRESERNGRKANDGKPSKKGKYRTGPYDSPN